MPVQGVERGEQAGLVLLDRGEQVVRLLLVDQVPGGLLLHVEGVGGHQRARDAHRPAGA
jgi:hypothetical protein